MKIYRVTDRIPVKIGDVEFKISPLSFIQRQEIQAKIIEAENGVPMGLMEAARLAVKYAVKDLTGVTDSEGAEYTLEFENGVLTDNCVDDLLNSDDSQRLQLLCTTLIQGVPKKLVDDKGNEIKGVVIGGNAPRKKK